MSNDEIQKFTQDIRSGATEKERVVVNQGQEAPRQAQPPVGETVSQETKGSFNYNWITIPLSIGFGYLLYLLFNSPDPKLEIEKHKTTILGWVQEMVESDLPPEVRQFYKAELKPGQTMIMYWQRNGDGPTREIIEFKPEHNEDIEKILQLRKKN